MASKQDRQPVRTPTDIERKYDLGKLAASQGLTAKQETKLNQLTQTMNQFMATTNGSFEEVDQKLEEMEGKIGTPGFSPTVNIEQIEGGHRITITDITGTKSFDVMDGYVDTPTNPNTTPKIGWVTLLATAWVGSDSLYHQVVNIEGVTQNSQVDLTPNVQQLAIFYEKDLAFVTENEGGIVTVYAIGQKPVNDYTIQVTITEVDV